MGQKTDLQSDSSHEENRLSTQSDWTETWADVEAGTLSFDFGHQSFSDIDSLFMRHLPRDNSSRFLEVGCCPGKYLWYFNHRFGYRPTGLDYLEDGCAETRARCGADGLSAEVIHADMFEFECSKEHPPWDVVASFGLIEHFEDIMPCLNRHIDLVRPGGHLVIVLPNHTGLNGTILKTVDAKRHSMHNLMSWRDLREGLNSTGRVDILEGGYFGRIGFWNTALYRKLRTFGRVPYMAARSPLYAVEKAGRILPNTRYLSPNIAVVARRKR